MDSVTRPYLLILTTMLTWIPSVSSRADQGADDAVDFVRDIRPVLSENCFFCHGPDADRRESDLRLDTAEGAAAVVTPFDSDSSELLSRMLSDDDDSRMPPPDSNRELSREQIELFRRWIDQGAVWQKHWSFRPLRRPPVPPPHETRRFKSRNAIDCFVQRRLEGTPLQPSLKPIGGR